MGAGPVPAISPSGGCSPSLSRPIPALSGQGRCRWWRGRRRWLRVPSPPRAAASAAAAALGRAGPAGPRGGGATMKPSGGEPEPGGDPEGLGM